MENNIKAITCLFNWILSKGINNLETVSSEIEGDEFLKVKIMIKKNGKNMNFLKLFFNF